MAARTSPKVTMRSIFRRLARASVVSAFVVLFSSFQPALGAEQKRAAVLEFELAPGIRNVDRTYLSDRVRSGLREAAPQLFVMTRESTEVLLQANGKSLADCTGECEVEIGRKLGADDIVSGRVTQFGSRILITMRLFSTADGQLLSSAEARGENLDKLLDAMDGAVSKLLAPIAAGAAAVRAPTAAQRDVSANPHNPAPAPIPAHSEARIAIDIGASPAIGGSEGVTIIEFADFQCPFCARVEPTLAGLRTKYGDRIRIVWKNLPLAFHRNAASAAAAALAADEQGKFWEMHDLLFANQQQLSSELYERLAHDLGLNMDRFHQALMSGRTLQAMQSDKSAAAAAGAVATPTFFINGRKLNGAMPVEVFQRMIDEELVRGNGH